MSRTMHSGIANDIVSVQVKLRLPWSLLPAGINLQCYLPGDPLPSFHIPGGW